MISKMEFANDMLQVFLLSFMFLALFDIFSPAAKYLGMMGVGFTIGRTLEKVERNLRGKKK